METFAIITTEANELRNPPGGPKLHVRMSVILAEKDYDRWLAFSATAPLPVDLLRPFPADEMKAWKVSAVVGNLRIDSPALCEPI